MNRDINILRIKPISLEQARIMRHIRAQHEIELWYKKEPVANWTTVLMSDLHRTPTTVKLPKASSKLLQDDEDLRNQEIIKLKFIISAEAQGYSRNVGVNF